MRAAVFDPQTGISIQDVAEPELCPGEALIDIEACGVCGSDKQVVSGEQPPAGTQFPVILGHEIAGRIAALNPPPQMTQTSPWRVGDEVMVFPFIPCGACRPCRLGAENLCTRQTLVGYHRSGGYAERIAVPTNVLLRRPPNVSASAAALLVDAFATPFHALVAAGGVRETDRVVVIGTGGTGLAGLMLARALGALGIGSITRRSDGAAAATAAGAEQVWVHDDERRIGREIRRWSEGGVDLVLDTVGTGTSAEFGLNLLRPGGRLCLVGMGAGEARLPVAKTVRRGIVVTASFGSTLQDVHRLLEFTQTGRLHPQELVAATLPLDRIAEAFQPHSWSGRIIVCPGFDG